MLSNKKNGDEKLLFLLVFDIKETEKFFVILFFWYTKRRKILKVFYLFEKAERRQNETEADKDRAVTLNNCFYAFNFHSP